MPLDVGALLSTTTVRDHRTDREKLVPWRPDGVGVLLLPHPGCRRCRRFLHALDGAAEQFSSWGRLRAVTTEASAADQLVEEVGFDVLLDAAGDLRRGLEVAGEAAAAVVLDAHGQVFFATDLDEHDFPPIDDLLVEARFAAVQCPECETPDIPSQIAPGVPLGVPRLTTGTHPMIGPADG